MAEPTTGRRRAAAGPSRRPSPVVLAAVVIPLLTVGTLALVRPSPDPEVASAAQQAPLTRSTLVCAPALAGADDLLVALSETSTDGEVVVRTRGQERTVPVEGATVRRRVGGPAALLAEGEAAPALVATRAGRGHAVACTDPGPETWFTGVGAGPEHSSRLVLTNPDRGPAVADVLVHDADGAREVPALRGIRVGGGRTVELDLAGVMPTRDALALRVAVSRGRLGAHVVDRLDPLGRASLTQQWLPGQLEARATSWILGTGAEPARRTLTIANPSEDNARVQVRLVTTRSEFVPAGLAEIDIPAGAVEEVDLSRVLRGRAAAGAFGLRLDASVPVAAALRSSVEGRLSLAVAGETITNRALAAVPAGPKRLVVGGVSAPGTLTWRVRTADGTWSEPERLEVDPGTATRLPLPRAATLLEVVVERAEMVASVEIGPPGLAVLALREQVTSALVPDVRPGLS